MTIKDVLYQVSGGSRNLKIGGSMQYAHYCGCSVIRQQHKIEEIEMVQQGGFQAPRNTYNPSNSTTVMFIIAYWATLLHTWLKHLLQTQFLVALIKGVYKFVRLVVVRGKGEPGGVGDAEWQVCRVRKG